MIIIPRDSTSPSRRFYRSGRESGCSMRDSKWNSDRAGERVHVNTRRHTYVYIHTYIQSDIRTKLRTTSRCKHKRRGVARHGARRRALDARSTR